MAPPLTQVEDIQWQLTTHLSTLTEWKAVLAWLVDLWLTVCPHKLSPISCRSSAGQGKFAGQRPTFYRCATQPLHRCWSSVLAVSVVGPCVTGLVDCHSVFFVHIVRSRTFGYKWHGILWAGCPFPTNSVKASKKAQSYCPNCGIILFSYTFGLLKTKF